MVLMAKDWTGDKNSVFRVLGASNHTDHDRAENDYYATDPIAIDALLEVETFDGEIWEPCCGEGHLSNRLKERGYSVISSDLIDRGYGAGNVDFFSCRESWAKNIVTNPPYSCVTEWTRHSLDILPEGGKLAMFLPIQFLETKKRRPILQHDPPVRVLVCSDRVLCAANGDFYERDGAGNIKYKKDGTPIKLKSAKCYAWFVWEKGYRGDTVIKLVNCGS